MTQPSIFISHGTRDTELVKILKDEIEEYLKFDVDVFASSLPDAIKTGEDWLKRIQERMEASQALIHCDYTRPASIVAGSGLNWAIIGIVPKPATVRFSLFIHPVFKSPNHLPAFKGNRSITPCNLLNSSVICMSSFTRKWTIWRQGAIQYRWRIRLPTM